MTAPKVYLAARYSRREELCVYRGHLQRLGFIVTSRWLDGDHQISDSDLNALGKTGKATVEDETIQAEDAVALRAVRFAEEDWADLLVADICVSFTEPPRASASRGGRHVEFGAALALGKSCLVVGPRENVFHCLPGVAVYPDWISALLGLGLLLIEHHRNQPQAVMDQ